MKDLERVLPWDLNSQRSLLWAYGGHPYAPSSVDIYGKQQQLVNLCSTIWIRGTPFKELGSITVFFYNAIFFTSSVALCWHASVFFSFSLAQKDFIEAAVSTNPELRKLAMQGKVQNSVNLFSLFPRETIISLKFLSISSLWRYLHICIFYEQSRWRQPWCVKEDGGHVSGTI